ncbi:MULTISPECIES: hypothetical protein [unclassified Blastomonas]|jgi:hypothetical protein|uniref:Uncharacterized protein n=2 Tax=Alphaproteobacteria TaxID=28211 RepID=A0A0B9AG34_9SPHN|nr:MULTISPECIES: hypothetical protein [unclassified Blastomonas]KHS49396.1 hypothetical protein NJ75_00099 [Novosphingobium subterraneum]KHS49618.1 hypothetical protein NJ75_00321 [Novosphingobium subterraneum]MAF59919.1 hypothetical protein [Blastomonas sp.]|tara:strand:+ start:63725 stop:64162 length:438 start_codon:yes stop_codon:yes gene_type:complete
MTRKAIYLTVFGLLTSVGGVAYVMADELPADMPAVTAPKPTASPKAPVAPPPPSTTAAQDHAHQQGMDHGGQQMHDQMMQDHQMGMQGMQQQGMQQQGMGGMAAQGGKAGMPMKPGKDCCPSKGMKPADKPMAMPSDKPMPMNDM